MNPFSSSDAVINSDPAFRFAYPSRVSPRLTFIPTQNADIVINVTTIIANPKMKPNLNVSILRTQAKGENNENTTTPKYSWLRFVNPIIDSAVDFRP